jgi:hypothetical protein
LRQYILITKWSEKTRNLYVEIPCPHPSELQEPLHVWTEGEKEVTVGLDYCHTHFTCSKEQNESEIFAEALSFLDDIFSERIVVMSWVPILTGKLGGASFNTPAEIEGEIVGTPPGLIVRIRSWKGTFLRDHKT